MTAVGGTSTASRYLKATFGWPLYFITFLGTSYEIKGEDKYGFSALPSGSGRYYDDDGGNLSYYDGSGIIWGAGENDSDGAANHLISGDSDDTYGVGFGKSSLFSVRCLKD